MTISLRGTANSPYQASPPASFPSTPVSGNLLTAIVSDRSGATTSSLDGSGWTKREEEIIAQADGTYRHYMAVWDKVAGASEPTTVTATTDSGGSAVLVLCEWESNAGETFTFSTSTSANTSNAGTITSQTTGTTGSTSGAVACIGVCSIKSPGTDIAPWTTWTNSFASAASYDGGTSVIDVSVSLLNSSATGTKSSTASGTGTDRSVGGAILVYTLGSSGATVNAVTATATASLLAPSVGDAPVVAVKATATATALNSAVEAETVVEGGGPATASAQMLIPGTISGEIIVEGGGPATASALLIPPTVTGGSSGGVTVTAVSATATAAANAPVIDVGVEGTVQAVTAIATIVALVPQVVAIEPTYRFSPPTFEAPMQTLVRPFNYFRLTYAASIVRVNGVLVEVLSPNTDQLRAAGVDGVDYFLGGREYVITEDVAEELTSAGYTVT